MDQNQKQLCLNVIDIKRRVLESIGTELTDELRASQIYHAYTTLCGEAQMAYADGLLNANIIALLSEYADRIIAFHNRVPA